MEKPIDFDKVADIYDFYVNVNFDVPFFLQETENTDKPVLELMCGTGRVFVPLPEAGAGYDYAAFDPDKSPFMIFKLTK